jgi:hypothetical protein
MSETEISKQIYKAIKRFFPRIQIVRHHCGLAKGWHGGVIQLGEESWPDYVGYLPDGRFLGVEVKDPKGKTCNSRQAKQLARGIDIQQKGGVYLKVSGVEECLQKISEVVNGQAY